MNQQRLPSFELAAGMDIYSKWNSFSGAGVSVIVDWSGDIEKFCAGDMNEFFCHTLDSASEIDTKITT